MSLFDSMDIGATGLKAQQIRMNVIADNIANVDTTRTREGGPYRRKEVVFATLDSNEQVLLVSDDGSFGLPKGVKVVDIATDNNSTKMVYKPDHPDANPQGYVVVPNIDTVTEMINMINATRAYEANLNVISSARDMMMRTLEIGR